MRGKRGQKGAGGAAAVIGLMGLFIVLYVLFLPGDMRDSLLNENLTDAYDNPTNDTGTNNIDYKEILMESPGRLDVLDVKECIGKECSHEINSFMLYKTTDSSIIEEFNPFVVKNNIMTKKFYSTSFEIDDIENTEDIMLTFAAPKNEGLLTIKLNGNILFEKDIDSFNPSPIELPKGYLAKTNNLEFSVSPVSWQFWHTNEYQIESMKIIGDITDLSRQKSSNVFYVGATEFYNTERAKLKFSPNCQQAKAAILDITLNGRNLYAGVPDCEMLNVIEFPPSYLEKGENTLIFRSDGGNYLVELVEVRTDLKDAKYPVYYFDVDTDDLEYIKDGDANLTATFEFVEQNVVGTYDSDYEDYNGEKQYQIIMTVNGHKKQINTYDEIYDRIIPYEDLREKDNWIKIEPRGDSIEVSQLLIELIPND